eukprot:COSAG02_NODE_574_length_20131_cov_7.523662_18_plen_123_part_00
MIQVRIPPSEVRVHVVPDRVLVLPAELGHVSAADVGAELVEPGPAGERKVPAVMHAGRRSPPVAKWKRDQAEKLASREGAQRQGGRADEHQQLKPLPRRSAVAWAQRCANAAAPRREMRPGI